MLTNGQIASTLYEYARLLKLSEGSGQSFRVRAYETAGRAIEVLPVRASELTVGELTEIGGIGPSSARKIRELVDTGTIGKLTALRQQFPPAFVELTRVPGVGPKTALLLRDHLGIRDLDGLRQAIEGEMLRTVPGLGAKTEENIARSLDRLETSGKDRRTPILQAIRVAADITEALAMVAGVDRAETMGSLRRFRDTIGDIDVIAVAKSDPESVMAQFVEMPTVREVVAYGGRKSAIISATGMQVDLRVVDAEQFGSAALYFTGSKAHNIKLRQRAIDRGWILNEYGLFDNETEALVASRTEEDVYEALGLSYIVPPLREDIGEIELAETGMLPSLVQVDMLRGDLHVHTDWSGDGREPLGRMIGIAASRGYGYVAITDHAEDLSINGLDRQTMLRQRSEIERLRPDFPAMRILHGAELNIGRDGTVDYDPEFLDGFEWGVASVHGQFGLTTEEQTERVVRAIHNPAVNAIGHLTGRRIGKRPGIDIDFGAVIDAAEETRTAIEINSHLDRLDAPVEFLHLARDRDVLFVISSDAHYAPEMAQVRWGVLQSQRGWVEPDRVVNTWPADRFLAWVSEVRRG